MRREPYKKGIYMAEKIFQISNDLTLVIDYHSSDFKKILHFLRA